MKIYLINGSPNGRKVLSVVRHLRLNPELVWLDLLEGDLQKPEYLRLNPNGLSPTLVHDDLVLWESNAILTYLCEVAPQQRLIPKSPVGRAEVNKWLSWELAHFNRSLGEIAYETIAKPTFGLGTTNEAIVDYQSQRFYRCAPVLEGHLGDREFIVGDEWSLADYALGHLEMFQQELPIDWQKFPNLCQFYDRFRANAFWQESAARSGMQGRKPG